MTRGESNNGANDISTSCRKEMMNGEGGGGGIKFIVIFHEPVSGKMASTGSNYLVFTKTFKKILKHQISFGTSTLHT